MYYYSLYKLFWFKNIETVEVGNRCVIDEMAERADEYVCSVEMGDGTIKRRRKRLLEETRKSVSESGKVMHLIKTFEEFFFQYQQNEQLEFPVN